MRRAAVVFVVGVVALASPARLVWLSPSMPWWAPYAAWAALIAAGAWASRQASPP
jgi:membrane protein implicated in regulation of membrane protease activity